MAKKYLTSFPKPLLDDLVAGRWLPVVGAGFSRNAILPLKKQMPLWNELGDLLKADLRDYEPSGALDSSGVGARISGCVERCARAL